MLAVGVGTGEVQEHLCCGDPGHPDGSVKARGGSHLMPTSKYY